MRPVMTLWDDGRDNRQGLFHRWGSSFHDSGYGSGSQTTAIVEFADGSVSEYEPRSIRFLDAPDAGSYNERRLQSLQSTTI